MVEGLALARVGRNREADEHLNKAQLLCDRSQSPLAGELADMNGVVAMGRNQFPAAEALFRKSLTIARSQQDPLLEASALLNLGSVTLKQEHYDDSTLWSTDADKVAHKLGARLAEEKALGNLGWAYYRLGDLDRSVDLFHQAADESRTLGAQSDLQKWLSALGMISNDTGNLSAAEDYYKQSLALAEKSEDKEDLVDAMTSIAAIAAERQEWELATRYGKSAIDLSRSSGDRPGELDALLVEGEIASGEKNTAQAMQLFNEVAADSSSEVPLKWEAENHIARLMEDEHQQEEAQRHYAASITIFENARSSLHQEEFRLPFLTNGVRLYDDEIHFLVAQGAVDKALQLADDSRAQTLAEGLGLLNQRKYSKGSVVTKAIAMAAKANAIILFYWLGPKYSYLWIIGEGRIKMIPLPPAAKVESLVRNYREELEGPHDVRGSRK